MKKFGLKSSENLRVKQAVTLGLRQIRQFILLFNYFRLRITMEERENVKPR